MNKRLLLPCIKGLIFVIKHSTEDKIGFNCHRKGKPNTVSVRDSKYMS